MGGWAPAVRSARGWYKGMFVFFVCGLYNRELPHSIFYEEDQFLISSASPGFRGIMGTGWSWVECAGPEREVRSPASRQVFGTWWLCDPGKH